MRGVATDLPRPISGSAAASVPQTFELVVSLRAGYEHVKHASICAYALQQAEIWQVLPRFRGLEKPVTRLCAARAETRLVVLWRSAGRLTDPSAAHGPSSSEDAHGKAAYHLQAIDAISPLSAR